jgi:hypothetical protein
MPSPYQKPYPKATNWRTLGLLTIIYAMSTITLRPDLDEKFNYGLAGLGAVSFVFVEGASLIRGAQRSYERPRDEEGYRADYEFVTHTMKALAGVLFFGAAFGDVQVARMVPVIYGVGALLDRS